MLLIFGLITIAKVMYRMCFWYLRILLCFGICVLLLPFLVPVWIVRSVR